MRALGVGLALLVAAGLIAGLYFASDRGGGSGRHDPADPDDGTNPLPPPDGTQNTTRDPEGLTLPETPEGFPAFVDAAVRRGAAAVPELLALLRSGRDAGDGRWTLRDGQLEALPTLRAAAIEALRRIHAPAAADALAEVFAQTESPEESYLAALALSEKGVRGVSEDLLLRAVAAEEPTRRVLVAEMARLAAREDPAAAARVVVDTAPRGEDGADPRVLAHALAALPPENAAPTAARLLADGAVTLRAKDRCLHEALGAGSVEVYAAVRETLERSPQSRELSTRVATAAVQSPAFLLDAIEYERAVAEHDAQAAGAARERYFARIREARRIVGAAFGVDPATTDDKAALVLLRRLDEHEARIR